MNSKNKIVYSILGLLIVFNIINCDRFKTYKSFPLTEKGEVIQLVYLPDTSNFQTAPGVGLNGNITFTFIDTGHKEVYAVVFKCYDHNKLFSLQGKEIYGKVKVNQIVDLKYVELYKIRNGKRIIYDYKTIEITVP